MMVGVSSTWPDTGREKTLALEPPFSAWIVTIPADGSSSEILYPPAWKSVVPTVKSKGTTNVRFSAAAAASTLMPITAITVATRCPIRKLWFFMAVLLLLVCSASLVVALLFLPPRQGKADATLLGRPSATGRTSSKSSQHSG